jgi:chromosome segregation ATPase
MDDYDFPEDTADQDYREDMQGIRLEKLSHRVTLITILIPILIVVIIVVSYLDIKQRVVQTQATGTIGVQNLSKNLESRFSSLSVRQAKLEDMIKKQTKVLDKNWTDYAIQKKKLENSIIDLSKRLADKKELSETARKFNTTLASLQKEITMVRTSMKTIEAATEKSLDQATDIEAEIQKKIQSLSQTTLELAENKLDRNQLDLALKIRNLKLKEQFQQQIEVLEKEITLIKNKVGQLSMELKSTLGQMEENSKPKTASKPKQNISPSKPAQTLQPKQGKIVEQDLN